MHTFDTRHRFADPPTHIASLQSISLLAVPILLRRSSCIYA
jgi:hypothetical protein